MDDLDPVVRQYLGVINRYKENSGMSTAEYARRLGTSDSNAGKKLRGEVAMTALELIETTWIFEIDFVEYFHVALDSLPERIHPPKNKAR